MIIFGLDVSKTTPNVSTGADRPLVHLLRGMT